ncbi:aspartate aminotransferase family protein [Cryomorpha ignava]|uniref:Aspartate aminotransferase family protein n=1 Tax=Cryomorpha ignava TaxID=101383 RepID=A0A7K3WT34_9FLAO|nr:aspartate aminotransferase family protein [Cryomorpha ignava]NEN24847.1 aspartate aminotransferase family protein [Cryomorpha ignava]
MSAKDDFLKYQAQTTPFPVSIEVSHAEGSFIYDVDGKAYADMVSGLAVTNVGHRHPKVIAAIEAQLKKYLHVMPYGEFIQSPQVNLARKLNAILPSGLDVSYFVNSGTEANEAALKLAKRYTGRRKIVSCLKSYHGSTHGSLSVSGNEKKKYAFRPLLPEVYFMRFNEMADLEIIDSDTACVIVETIQGDAGVRIPTHSYMQALRKRCDDTGALLILDEIQAGFGRTGKLFAFEHFGIVPDILTIAKSIAGGMAMGAFVSSKEIMKSLISDPILGHITTFGGHPVCCAAAIGNLEAIEGENMVETCEEKGALLESCLSHPAIIEIRRIGLMFAVEFSSADLVYKIVDRCLEKGIIAFYFLSCPESFRLAPPLNMSDEDLVKAGKTINEVIGEICG